MFSKRLPSTLSILAASIALAACGGGGGSDSAEQSSVVTSSGVITQFGSVHVNKVRYRTTNARIVSADDGSVIIENPTDAELRMYLGLGQTVKIRGTRSDDSNGVARSISVDNELVGPITSIDADLGSFVVLGQTVTVTPDTIIDDSIVEAFRGVELPDDLRFGDLTETLAELLAVDMVVEIHGFPTQNGIEATRIEDVDNRDRIGKVRGANEVEVKGVVRNLSGNQFQINDLTVTFEVSDLDDDFGSAGLVEGQFVEVEGVLVSATEIDATEIELEDDLFDDDDDNRGEGEVEIEGVVQEVIPDAQGTGGVVVINGLRVRVNDVTPFSVGLRVELEGSLQSDGTVVIDRVEDESEDTVRIEDLAVSADATSLTTRLGVTITPTGRSRLEDDVRDLEDLSVADFLSGVGNGSRIEARGFPMANGVTWTRVEIEDDDDQDCRLRGPVSDKTGTVADFTFTIQGVTIDVSQISSFNNFQNANDVGIGRQAFFDQLDNGDVVQASAEAAGCVTGTLTAGEVQFEDGDGTLFVGDDNGGAGGDDNGVNDNQVVGEITSVGSDSIVVAGRTLSVNASTLIDDSIIEAALGGEILNDLPFGDLTATLQQLLSVGMLVEVGLNGDVATRIEDVDVL